MNNIFLIGPPGAGKTSVGIALGEILNMSIFDIDDDYLEPFWGETVAQKLEKLGDEEFIKAEGEALIQLHIENTIVSLSGSNPLHSLSMQHCKNIGEIIFLDTPKSIILDRMDQMKVNRIIGMSGDNPKSLSEILDYRAQFYEKYYDKRIIVTEGETPSQIAQKIVNILKKNENFTSTREENIDSSEKFNFLDVVKKGLSPNGGLFVPEKFPEPFLISEIKRLSPLSYTERCIRIFEKFPLANISPQDLRKMVENAYEKNFHHPNICSVRHLKNSEYLLDLFHGPTASFKDMALQLTPYFFERAIQEENKEYLILTATSGDTGIAAIEGFKRIPKVSVMVMYPEKGVSVLQKAQMQTVEGENVHVIGINGDFDFCQTTAKNIFSDTEFQKILEKDYNTKLSAANSLNWGRLLPQIAYYFSGYLDLIAQSGLQIGDMIEVCVPTGNFGDILAGIYAKNLGLPISKFICASNENCVLTDFFNTGIYDLRNRPLIITSSPSIDILKSSNLERFLFFISNGNKHFVSECYKNLEEKRFFEVPKEIKIKMDEYILSHFCSESECLKTIQETFQNTGKLVDPHTAIAITVSDKTNTNGKLPRLILSTAHFWKFLPTVAKSIGYIDEGKNEDDLIQYMTHKIPNEKIHPQLDGILQKKKIHTNILPAEKNAIQEEILRFLRK